MTVNRTARAFRRRALVGATALTAAALAAAPAMAHHCYVPLYSLGGPVSANWLVISAEEGAALIADYEPTCDTGAQAGYAALRSDGMPVGIKIFEKMTIGDPKETGRTNPNGANGVGLEYFGAGSTLADDMVATWIAGAEAECAG